MARAEWAGFPEDAVAVADNGSGDMLVIRKGSDEIELWLHETREVLPAPDLEL
jgi:hypothetical protein